MEAEGAREMEQGAIHVALSERAMEYLVPADAQFVKCRACLKQVQNVFSNFSTIIT